MNINAQLQLILSTLAGGPRPTAELRRILGDISPATLSRLMSRLGQQVVVLGQSRATQYALPRDIRGAGSRFPLYRVDEQGNAHRFGELLPLLGGAYWWQPASGAPGQLYRYLPWFIQDLRPDGFMGRAFAQRIGPDLGLPIRLPDWNDDHVLVALVRRGEDIIGNLIVGEASLARYLERERRESPVSTPDDYPHLAEKAIAGDPVGSSAAGEQPKFSTLVECDGSPCHVIVKFSPPLSTPEGERWSDLLVCEHLALNVIQDAGITAVRSTIFTLGGRTFLEARRFDRAGRLGRLPVQSLGVIDDEFFGHRDSWTAMAGRLSQTGMMSQEDADMLIWLDLFGAMIGNTDRHFGNVSVQPVDMERNRFRLAPAYDMLPMTYRPRQGEDMSYIPFSPPPVTTARTGLVDSALQHAAEFWLRVSVDNRISARFRTLCVSNLEAVQAMAHGPRVVG